MRKINGKRCGGPTKYQKGEIYTSMSVRVLLW